VVVVGRIRVRHMLVDADRVGVGGLARSDGVAWESVVVRPRHPPRIRARKGAVLGRCFSFGFG
jgi:hypothetical protein